MTPAYRRHWTVAGVRGLDGCLMRSDFPPASRGIIVSENGSETTLRDPEYRAVISWSSGPVDILCRQQRAEATQQCRGRLNLLIW